MHDFPLMYNAKLTCNFCGEQLCKMELRDIHKNERSNICQVQLFVRTIFSQIEVLGQVAVP